MKEVSTMLHACIHMICMASMYAPDTQCGCMSTIMATSPVNLLMCQYFKKKKKKKNRGGEGRPWGEKEMYGNFPLHSWQDTWGAMEGLTYFGKTCLGTPPCGMIIVILSTTPCLQISDTASLKKPCGWRDGLTHVGFSMS